MPELAEVEFFRKQWEPALGQTIKRVRLHPDKRVFRGCNTPDLIRALTGARFEQSLAHGKQLLFHFSGGHWLGLHLGMTGKTAAVPLPHAPDAHEHLLLETRDQALIFRDPRLFGRIRFDHSATPPDWWQALPPPLLSEHFTQVAMDAFLLRRSHSPLKAVLLMQERFPGIGNWMADEILWRAALHPARHAGSLNRRESSKLFLEIKQVCRDAIEVIGSDWGTPPDSWLFNHRWKDGGHCPRTGKPLQRETIGGRTTCWSPARQPEPERIKARTNRKLPTR